MRRPGKNPKQNFTYYTQLLYSFKPHIARHIDKFMVTKTGADRIDQPQDFIIS